MVPVKRCSVCKIVKPVSDFYLNGQRPRSSCKSCDLTKKALQVPAERGRKRAYNQRYYAAKKIGAPLAKPDVLPVGTKRCTGCKEILQFGSFNRFKGTSDGYASKCRRCNAADWQNLKGRPVVESASCHLCNLTKPASEFGPYPGNKTGLESCCKKCNAKRYHEYYLANREEMLEKERLARLLITPEQRKVNNARSAASRRARPEKRLEDNRRRRAKRLGSSEPGITAAEWRAVLEYHDYRCAYCLEKPEKIVMDHIIALVVGGEHSPDNVVPACASCNGKKGPRPIFMMAKRITR